MEADLYRAHERLVEWGKEKHYPGWDIPAPTGGVLGRMIDEGRDDRLKAALKATRRKDAKFRLAMRKLGIKLGRRRKGDRGMPCKESRAGRMEILTHEGEAFPSAPDGGLGEMVDRMADSVERNRQCREVGEFVNLMPDKMRELVRVTYGTAPTPGDVPRQAKAAAKMIGVSESTYFRLKNETLIWLAERLGLRSAAAA